MMEDFKFVFFGSADFSVLVLNELKARGVLPSLVVTTPDKPKGRKLILTPNVVKTWAVENNIEVLDPKSLKDPAVSSQLKAFSSNFDFFLVAAYGKIMPSDIFDIPKFKTINIHPSLLPKYRGASPMISQILNDEKDIGTSIMLIDEGMDTGPVLAQKVVGFPSPYQGEGGCRPGEVGISELETLMAHESVSLLLETLPKYLSGGLKPVAQNNDNATYSEKIKKEDGLIDLGGDAMPTGRQARVNLLKIKAFAVWPRAYYFHNDKRIIVTDATLDEAGKLKLLRVIPEGKSEMSYEDFLRGNR